MKKLLLATTILAVSTSIVNARPYYHHHRHHRYHIARHHRGHTHQSVAEGLGAGLSHMLESAGRNAAAARRRGLAWCGAYMADVMHVAGAYARELWVAANWARWGHPASPHVGAVVVWRHHVGKIVGGEPGSWIILSGNDGHAVRARRRSLAGVIAIRE